MIDITVIITEPNPSADKAIQFAEEKGLKIEVLDDIMHAKGKYVCIFRPEFCYEDYYLHYQFLCLEFRNPRANCIRATKCICFDKDKQEFYVGKATAVNIFYKRITEDRHRYYTEKDIFLFSTTCKLDEIQEILPPDNILYRIGKYFNSPETCH